MKYELYTLVGNFEGKETIYPREGDIVKREYTEEESKTIRLEAEGCELIYASEEYDELCGPDPARFHESEETITDEMLLVDNGRFFGCLLKSERTIYYSDGAELKTSLVAITPDSESARISSMDGDHGVYYAYSYRDAYLKRR